METRNGMNHAPDEGVTRRGFYTSAIFAMGAVMTAALGAPAAAYLLLGARKQAAEDWVDFGDIAKLAEGEPVEMVGRRNHVDGWKVVSEKVTAWVVRKPEGVIAFGPQCTHLGCAHHWDQDQKKFICPCHASLFSIEGKVLSGPAPRPLDRFDLKIEGNRLLLGSLRQQQERSA